MSWVDEYVASITRQQCIETETRSGLQCGLIACVGSRYCKYHGGGDKITRFVDPRTRDAVESHVRTSLIEFLTVHDLLDTTKEKLIGTTNGA